MKKMVSIGLLGLVFTFGVTAQTTQDPAITAAKAKLEVVYDLGRIFGYIHTMDRDQKKLALTSEQTKALLVYADTILKDQRIEPDEAEKLLGEIEDTLLSPAQLMYVDELAIAWMQEKTGTTGTGAGSTGGTSPVQSYLNGGPFNPMLDTTKTLGKDFKAAYDYLKAKK